MHGRGFSRAAMLLESLWLQPLRDLAVLGENDLPQRLKPILYVYLNGTAEAVP